MEKEFVLEKQRKRYRAEFEAEPEPSKKIKAEGEHPVKKVARQIAAAKVCMSLPSASKEQVQLCADFLQKVETISSTDEVLALQDPSAEANINVESSSCDDGQDVVLANKALEFLRALVGPGLGLNGQEQNRDLTSKQKYSAALKILERKYELLDVLLEAFPEFLSSPSVMSNV